MGITGLIPFLEKASNRGNISQFAGCTVAIDTYCWLHKGAFSCADKIALGQPTDAYVKYCMRLVHMLLANKIKPILVFDGRHLPAKKETEAKRRENRQSTRRRAAELMKMGQTAEGRNLLRRSVDITHEMALQLIKKCHEENVDCIVAPYEADAQLAYLNITGIADVVITEDSDLTLFGCKKIFFKMDITGNGILVEQDRIHLAMNMRAEHFEIEKFRHMCILSGCDYLASLPGIGLSKACKFVLRNREEDIYTALGRLGSYLNMRALIVTTEYRDAFMRALVTFKHQLVYCPLQRKQVRLYPPSSEVTDEQLHFAGDEINEDVAYQMALGNYDPFTMRELHDFDPDLAHKRRVKTNSWHKKSPVSHVSIWSSDYKIREERENEITSEITKWPNTTGRIVTLKTDVIKRKATTPKKRDFRELADELSPTEALELYTGNKFQKNDESTDGRKTLPSHLKSSSASSKNDKIKSPMSPRRTNPFVITRNNSETSPSLVMRGKRRINLKNFVGFRRTVIDDNNAETSKYFSPNSTTNDTRNEGENYNRECPKTVDPRRKEIEKCFVEKNEREDNRKINIIDETPSQEETSSSTDIFSSDTIEKNSDMVSDMVYLKLNSINENERHEEMSVIPENEKFRNFNDSRNSDRLLDAMYDSHSYRDSPSVPTQTRTNESEYSHQNDNIDDPRCSLLKWTNTKNNAKTSVNGVPSTKKPIVTAKTKSARKITSQRKSVPVDSQQSLLNMFGFQKKPVLKH